ncbi:MAG TPA: HEXXH motif-containing putative peptide modification protein [Labilithrix sp.]|nr:HEXXH motif-containing putative peptide modification protein [Labilithrix sp.]
MTDEANRYRGFSCPQESLDLALMEEISTTHFRRALRTFVSRHGALLEERGAGLSSLFLRWLDTTVDFDTVWHIAFGRMREVLAQQHGPASSADVVLAAARLGLRLCERGMLGAWRLPLEAPVSLRLGPVMLPACDGLDVVAEDGALTLTLASGAARAVVRLRGSARGWEAVAGAAQPIPSFDTGVRTVGVLLPDTPEGLENEEHALVVDEAVRRTIWSGYHAAFNMLREHAPLYLPYVNRVLRNLVPVTAEPGGYIGGGSLRDNPGTVKLPFEDHAVGLAANLAHECAHQHYFLLRGAGRIDDGSDLSLYTSGFIDGERDLPSIVLTYHAFANEALVLRICERAGLPDPYAGERAEAIRANLAPLEGILAGSRALTPLGRALWEPAAEQLHRAFA